MSERDILAVFAAQNEVEEQWRMLAGTICAAVRNAQRGKRDYFFKWTDFFKPIEKKGQKRFASAEELDQKMGTLVAYGNAKRAHHAAATKPKPRGKR